MAENFDLFGDPVPDGRGGRGRPQHVPTKENRNRVNMLLALGWAGERIAAALRITLPTLRRHYFSELKYREVARDRLEMRRAEQLWKAAEGGNVGAMREFARFLERNDRVVSEHAMGAAPGKKEKAPAPVGKKVIDAQRAVAADADLMAELEAEASNARLHS